MNTGVSVHIKRLGYRLRCALPPYALLLCILLPVTLLLLSAFPSPSASKAESGGVLPADPAPHEELAGTVVNCMFQDSAGFLWFGTQIGLYRYNGYRLESYPLHSGLANQLLTNLITSLGEDNGQHLWVGTFGGGLFRLDRQTGEYDNFSHDPQNTNSLGDNAVRAILPDDSGKLWIGTQNNGLDCLEPLSGNFTHYRHRPDDPESIASNNVTSLVKDWSGSLWIGTADGGLNQFDPRTGKFLSINKSKISQNNNITNLYLDRENILWIATGAGGLDRFDPVAGKFLDAGFPELANLKVNAVCEDNSGDLWIGTYGQGVKMLDRNRGEFITRDLSSNPSSSLYRVISLYGDASGNLWIGAEGSGLDKINTGLSFTSYKSDPDSDVVFSDDVVLSLCKDQAGTIWIGTANGGVNSFDRENKRIKHYKNDPNNRGSISGNAISSIFEDSRGTLWLGTIDGILNKFEPASRKFVHYNLNSTVNPAAGDNGIMQIYEGEDSMLWLCAANGGLVRFDRNTGRYTQFTANPLSPEAISSNHVLSLAGDAGMLWVGTGEGGLNNLDLSSHEFTRYGIAEPGSSDLTFNYSVNAIVNDNGRLWLGTDRGLYRFDKQSGTAVFVGDPLQAAQTAIFGLLKDDRDSLWLSTASRLIKYHIPSVTFRKYDFTGGLQRNQYTPGAYFVSSDGELFFGGVNGFSCFFPEQIRDNTHKPPVVITDLKIFDTSLSVSGREEISLTYKDNFISFEFSALDYAEPVKNQYAYKMEGFDADWHYSGTRNYAGYTNLNGGDYIFRVRAANNDGLWNEEGAQIRVVVVPPFWKRPWFITASLLCLLASVIAAIRLRLRSIRLKSRELERQVQEKTRELNQANEQLRQADALKNNFLSLVSHEIKTPLSAILGFTELITGKIEKTILPKVDLSEKKTQKAAETIVRDLNIISSEGDRLSTLVNNLLNISKIESGKMDRYSRPLSISVLISQALSITKPIIEKSGLAIQVAIDESLQEIFGDQDMLTQVLINLISNAVKFTKEGYLKISARDYEGQILVSLEDTGLGIREDHLNRIFEKFYKAEPSSTDNGINVGLGLYISKQIIEQHGGTVWVESQFGKGSTFYFTLPYYSEQSPPS